MTDSPEGGGDETQSGASLSEPELVRRAGELDEDALSALFSTYFPKIYAYSLPRLGDAQAAEDVASDVMLKVLESIERYQPKGAPFAAWVYRIARNRLIDLARRNRLRQEVGLSESLALDTDATEDLAEQALGRQHIRQAMRHLTEDQRQVLILKFIEGFSTEDVAHIIGRSRGAVKCLQFRALNALRRVMWQDESRQRPAPGRAAPAPAFVLTGDPAASP